MLKNLRAFMKEEDGMATVEVILILVVLVALVTMFQGEIKKVADEVLKKISKGARGINV